MNKTGHYIEALRRANMRITSQRRAICSYLAVTELHPTPYQVYAQVSQEHPSISLATIYNTLNTLRDLGVITEISVGADHTHYDTNTAPHVNLICLACDTVHDYDGEIPLESVQAQITAETGFAPVAGKIELMGFCADCRQRKVDEIRQQAQTKPAQSTE